MAGLPVSLAPCQSTSAHKVLPTGGNYINASYVASAVGEVPPWRFIATQVCSLLLIVFTLCWLIAVLRRRVA